MKPRFSLIEYIFGCTVTMLLMLGNPFAQTLTPVTAQPGSGIPWWVGFAVAGVILIAGFVWLKVKKPTVAGKVETAVSADVAALTAAIGRLVDHAAPATADLSSAQTAEPTVNPLQQPLDAANGKLAQIKAILDA